MSFTKLRPELAEILVNKSYPALNDFQEKIIDQMKSGKNLCVEGEDGSGKSSSILYAVLQRITEPGEGSPRAVIICADDARAIELATKFKEICRYLDLTVDLAHEKGNKLQQRNDLFDGTEIIIGTPKRICELYIQNGFNVSKLKMFVVDDFLEMIKKGHGTSISRVAESLPKCQMLFYSYSFKDDRIEHFLEEYVTVVHYV